MLREHWLWEGARAIFYLYHRDSHTSLVVLCMWKSHQKRAAALCRCALVKWMGPLAGGRRSIACNTVCTGEKTRVEWGCKGMVSDVVQMWESSVRDNLSLPSRWPAEPAPLFRARQRGQSASCTPWAGGAFVAGFSVRRVMRRWPLALSFIPTTLMSRWWTVQKILILSLALLSYMQNYIGKFKLVN